MPHDQKHVEEFLAYAEPLTGAYRHSTLSYIALRSEEGFAIAQARLLLNVTPSIAPFTRFESRNVRAGQCPLGKLQLDVRGVINDFVAGKISTPHGEFAFPASEGGRYGTTFLPFLSEALQTQRRISILRLMGGQIGHIPQPQLDWEIKASPTPYDGLQDSMNEYLLGSLSNNACTLEVAAFHVVAIDLSQSVVNGETAEIYVVLAGGLSADKMQLGYRVMSGGRVAKRAAINGANLEWAKSEGTLLEHFPKGWNREGIPFWVWM